MSLRNSCSNGKEKNQIISFRDENGRKELIMTWIVPCNLKYYDVEGAFQTLKTVDWKQQVAKVQKNDTVLIYISSPVRAILYNCTVVKTNKKESTIDDSTFVIKGDIYKDYGCYMEPFAVKKYNQG